MAYSILVGRDLLLRCAAICGGAGPDHFVAPSLANRLAVIRGLCYRGAAGLPQHHADRLTCADSDRNVLSGPFPVSSAAHRSLGSSTAACCRVGNWYRARVILSASRSDVEISGGRRGLFACQPCNRPYFQYLRTRCISILSI